MSKPVVMLIADGNRRWSSENNISIQEGYIISGELLAKFYDHLNGKVNKLYIPVCTSSNLTKRPSEQVPWFLDCFITAINKSKKPINLQIVGDLGYIPDNYKKQFVKLEEANQDRGGLDIVYTVGWSSDLEVIKICQNIKSKPKKIDDVKNLSTIKDEIDLIIRCGKEKRLSAMIPLFSPYAELYFIDEYFPNLSESMLDDALIDFANRKRRFGGG